ncbi:protein ADP-ribosyltransferase PARP3-like isoform X2 [Solanum lycopersicum]|uniref:protein ADP-ribosyltransferase PARP3-like isoform X2 n=1 Tax=Solanum lycopersicum TaxID=4081 RepID=UPI000532D1EB|nr:poly [ADP-ribose] polymerase 3-like isoform X2 [Solanum lycopersicum]
MDGWTPCKTKKESPRKKFDSATQFMQVKVHETRSQAHSTSEERKVMRKQQAESNSQETASHKKAKTDDEEEGVVHEDGIRAEFEKFCKTITEHLSVKQMREILEANGQYSKGEDDAVVPRCQDVMFYGPLDNCPICGGKLECSGDGYHCVGDYSEWSSCIYSTKEPPRREESLKLPESVESTPISDLIKKRGNPNKSRPRKEISSPKKPFDGMVVSLAGRLTRKHQYWKSKIEKFGGEVNNSITGVACVVVSPAERDRGGSSKVAEALEKGIPVVREAWLSDSIEKEEAQSLDAYDIASDIAVEGKGIPLDKMDPSAEALETVTAELKVYGKRGVHKDSKMQDEGARILEKDGLLYNCALSICNQKKKLNDFCIMQLVMSSENRLHMYLRRGRNGDSLRADDKLEEWENVDYAIKEFARLFEEMTGNEFEHWEREKKIHKKHHKFYPIDIDDGIEVRHGALGLRQLGSAAAHSKLDSVVANFMKVLCSQEIYRYALMELVHDSPEIPIGMLTNFHLRRCEEILLHFVEKIKSMKETGPEAEGVWHEFSQMWFTLMPSTRPFTFRDYTDLAEHAASAYETIRDINFASRIIEDMSGSTLDDPLFECYKKLRCSVSPLEKESDDYKMIVNYLEKTYEPVQVGDMSYGISVENIFAVEASACPSLDEIKGLPNKVLLWCGTRSSNLLRHLQKGFLPSVCSLPVSGYMFGRAIVCTDAAAEAARYGFTAVDRPESFLVLAVASLGDEIKEFPSPPEDTRALEEKKIGVKGLGRKKTNEKEHFVWKDDIKVPCGKLIPSEHKDSVLEYNEYAVYDPQQVSIRYLVAVKFDEQDVVYDTAEPEPEQ